MRNGVLFECIEALRCRATLSVGQKLFELQIDAYDVHVTAVDDFFVIVALQVTRYIDITASSGHRGTLVMTALDLTRCKDLTASSRHIMMPALEITCYIDLTASSRNTAMGELRV